MIIIILIVQQNYFQIHIYLFLDRYFNKIVLSDDLKNWLDSDLKRILFLNNHNTIFYIGHSNRLLKYQTFCGIA